MSGSRRRRPQVSQATRTVMTADCGKAGRLGRGVAAGQEKSEVAAGQEKGKGRKNRRDAGRCGRRTKAMREARRRGYRGLQYRRRSQMAGEDGEGTKPGRLLAKLTLAWGRRLAGQAGSVPKLKARLVTDFGVIITSGVPKLCRKHKFLPRFLPHTEKNATLFCYVNTIDLNKTCVSVDVWMVGRYETFTVRI